jgi:para-nitrobenzyl esterase
MYEFNEEVVSGRRARGDTAGNWNAGVASPMLTVQSAPAR